MESNNTEIRIILADDNTPIRKSWKKILESNPLFTVLADCENGLVAQQLVNKLRPDILLMDLTNSPADGLLITEKIVKQFPAVKVVGISVSNRPHYAIKMISLGAKGYLTKTSPLTEIYAGIIRVFEGQTYICEEIRYRMIKPE